MTCTCCSVRLRQLHSRLIVLLPGTSPPKGHLFSLAEPDREAMEEYINKSLEAGIICLSSSHELVFGVHDLDMKHLDGTCWGLQLRFSIGLFWTLESSCSSLCALLTSNDALLWIRVPWWLPCVVASLTWDVEGCGGEGLSQCHNLDPVRAQSAIHSGKSESWDVGVGWFFVPFLPSVPNRTAHCSSRGSGGLPWRGRQELRSSLRHLQSTKALLLNSSRPSSAIVSTLLPMVPHFPGLSLVAGPSRLVCQKVCLSTWDLPERVEWGGGGSVTAVTLPFPSHLRLIPDYLHLLLIYNWWGYYLQK